MHKRILAIIAGALLYAGILCAAPQNPTVTLTTNQGDLVLELWPEVAPEAVENFIRLAESGYYDGIIFHRVIPGFMIQGGDPKGTGTGGRSVWGQPFADEVSPSVTFDKPFLLAMANAGPNTNGSQFFITTNTTPWLNMRHTIFGQVVEGQKTVSAIENVPRDRQDKPLEKQVIQSAVVVRGDYQI